MQFSQEQQLAFDKYIQGNNIFITGPGGTGKSSLIKYIYQDACRKGINIHVCALTGCAAVLLECKAKTIHSWGGIGLGNGTIEQIITKINKNKYAKSNWKKTNILIIDEVSMMSHKLFEILDGVGKKIRKNSKPFGGIQLLFSGDFYQLPPVGNNDEIETTEFCFQSLFWQQTFTLDNHIQLIKIFRQSDPIYQKILNQVREGRIKKSTNIALLNNVGRSDIINGNVKPTKLFPTRNQVDNINIAEMNNLEGKEIEYKVKYHNDLEMTAMERMRRLEISREQIKTELTYLKGNLRCDEILKLKIGAQVMCIVNIQLENDDILCNGAQGIVIKIDGQGFPVVRYRNGYEMVMTNHVWPSETIPGIGVSQVPLILAWALTIHKSQGSTLDVAEIDAGSSIFECGQTYVALSRVKSLEGLYLTSFDVSKIKINKKVQEFYANLSKK
jgi:ATP-dependent DNA helicase PIF1